MVSEDLPVGTNPEPGTTPASATPPQRHRKRQPHAAYQDLPHTGRIGEQLRDLVTLSHQFQAKLGKALDCNETDLAAMQLLIDDGPTSPSSLARNLGITSAAATMVVDRLEGLGHVTRAAHASDRRRVVVVPAEASISAAVTQLMPIIAGVGQAVDDLSAHDRGVVENFLQHVIGIYESAVRNPAS